MHSQNDLGRVLVLLRGLPGSGKTTLAGILSMQGQFPVTSVDSYFTDPHTGEYVFDHRQNHLAYKQCEALTRQYMEQGSSRVFVDNTFTLEWEMEPYFKMAAELGYALFVVTVENRQGHKNVHGVSDGQLRKMAEKYKVVLF